MSMSESKRHTFHCSYCNKDGHTNSRCFQRKRDFTKSAKASSPTNVRTPVVTSPNSQQANVTSSSSCCSSSCKSASTRPALQRAPKYCVIHDFGNHSTEDCNLILNQKANRTRTTIERPSKYCVIHDIGNHSTEECSFVLEKKREFVVTHDQSKFYQCPPHRNNR